MAKPAWQAVSSSDPAIGVSMHIGMTTTMKRVPVSLDPLAAARFWDDVRIGDSHICWPWVGERGTRESTGHIRIWHQGAKVYAHRVAFLLAAGDVDDGEVVRHAVCDRPDCMNYLHMRAGTSADNTRDRDERNRRTPLLPRGEQHWSAKLSNQDALRIRAAKQLGLNAHHIAAMFGVSRSTVYSIWSGIAYAAAQQEPDAA